MYQWQIGKRGTVFRISRMLVWAAPYVSMTALTIV
jgi:hypothetical protein